MTHPQGLTDYAGIIHLHSRYSFDGRTPLPDILADADRCGLDFLLLTDHSTLQARDDGFEGWRGRTLLVVGEEIAPRFNHYLAFRVPGPVLAGGIPPQVKPQELIDRVRNRGGIGFIAHPDHKGTALFHVKHYPWTDWSVSGYTGLGIWDFMTDWQNGLTGYFPALLSYVFPALSLKGPSPATLARWDAQAQERRVVGIGELDNHNTRVRFLGLALPVFPFGRVFGLIRTHILTPAPLTGDSPADIATLLQALENGHAYVALDHYRPSKGFSLTLAEGGRSATMGDEFVLDRRAGLTLSLPHKARIRIIRNGTLFRQADQTGLTTAIDAPGVYRIEAALRIFGRYRPWIFSNPIYVRKS
jgi:hypothetical protein